MSNNVYDITIIGAGPAGLFTAFYGGLRQAEVKIIESFPHIGGQLTALYPEKFIYDVAGFPKISAQQLVDHLYEQVKPFDQTIVLGQSIEQVERLEDDTIQINMHTSETLYTKSLLSQQVMELSNLES